MNQDAIYDARQLGVPKMLLLGLQHMFAMFGATILVPAITGLSISATLLFAGLGTLLFHLITGRKVPAFLGSSFAFLGAYGLVTVLRRRDSIDVFQLWCRLRRTFVSCAGSAVQGLRRTEGHALLPAHCHRPRYHCHWPDPVSKCH